MHLKTILNRVYAQPGFVFAGFEMKGETKLRLEITLVPRAGSKASCSGCNRKGPGYDTLPVRRFEFVPLWGIVVFFLYAMRRVDCPFCGVKVEVVPWALHRSAEMTRVCSPELDQPR